MRKPKSGFSNRFDTNRPVQSQKQTRDLQFWIEVEEEFFYSSTENKGAVLLCSYCTADLRLCFSHICRLFVFWCGGSIYSMIYLFINFMVKCLFYSREHALIRRNMADKYN